MMAKGRYARLGARRSDLEAALSDRIRDAEVLIDGGRVDASITMGFYALEIALKIAICQRLELEALAVEFQIHDLDDLLLLSGLGERIKSPAAQNARKDWDYFRATFSGTKINNLRYGGNGYSSRQAKNFIRRLLDPDVGFLRWLSSTT